jgi:hypothetical protein
LSRRASLFSPTLPYPFGFGMRRFLLLVFLSTGCLLR